MNQKLNFTFTQFHRKFGTRFPKRYDFSESEEMLLTDPPVEFSFVGSDGFTYVAIISPGGKVELYKIITSYANVEKGQKKRIEKILGNKKIFNDDMALKEFQTRGIFDFYDGTEATGTFIFKFSTREEHLQSIVNNVKSENPSAIVYTPRTVIQKYVDDKQIALPGETTVRETTTQKEVRLAREQQKIDFAKEKLAEFVCLIVLEPVSGLPHLFVYWTGSFSLTPNDPKQNFFKDTIAYYLIDLADSDYKNQHGDIYSRLLGGLSEGSEQGEGVSADPLSFDFRKAFFDMKPVNPPEDRGQYSEDQLKHMPIKDDSLIGWFMNIEETNAPGEEYLDDAGKKSAKFRYRSFAGNKMASQNFYLFSHKVHPPVDILTAFDTGKSAITSGFVTDNHPDALKVGFTTENFKQKTQYLIRYLKAFPDKVKIKITGHTDSEGDGGSNLKLSRKRAYAFYTYLKNSNNGLGVALTKDEAENQIGPDVTFDENKDIGDYIVGEGEALCKSKVGEDKKDPAYRKITIKYEGVRH